MDCDVILKQNDKEILGETKTNFPGKFGNKTKPKVSFLGIERLSAICI